MLGRSDSIYTETHKIIAKGLSHHLAETYGVVLNEEKILWGAVAPDVTPFYKFIRHYERESLDYITREILRLIHLMRRNPKMDEDETLMRYMSKKIGVISHYLCDYVTYPHAHRMLCTSSQSAKAHLRYEVELHRYAVKNWNKARRPIQVTLPEHVTKGEIKAMIQDVVAQYHASEAHFSTDLGFALALNCTVFDVVFQAATVTEPAALQLA